ncbi:MAG: hypothetical protein RLY57_548 [Candidatus Parcubacteria bacterium]|jgi:hypothetical protein
MKYKRKFMTSMLALTLLSSSAGYTVDDLISYSKQSEYHNQVHMKSPDDDQNDDYSNSLDSRQRKINKSKNRVS